MLLTAVMLLTTLGGQSIAWLSASSGMLIADDRGTTRRSRDDRLEGDGLYARQRGRALFDRIVEAHRMVLQRLAARWSPEQHEEAKAMLDGLARNLIAELPIAPARQPAER